MIGFDPHFILIVFVFLLAGTVKGITGMGLPAVSMGLLGLVMLPAQAAALLILPSFITNFWQAVAGPYLWPLLRRIWSLLVSAIIVTWMASGLVTGRNAHAASIALGGVLAVYALLGLFKFRLPHPGRAEPWLSPIVGAATGVFTGATGVFTLPAVPYLNAMDLEKEELIQALGLFFNASTIGLAAGLASHGAFHLGDAGVSLIYTVPALIGMYAGGILRQRIDAALFRKLFFIGLFLLGLDLMI